MKEGGFMKRYTIEFGGGVTQKQDYPFPEQRGAWLDWLKQKVEENE
jgi:hypothetical protein